MKLFLRIFLSFWLATILMIVAVLGVSEILPYPMSGDGARVLETQSATSALTNAVNVYEGQGPAAFRSQLQDIAAIHHNPIYLFNDQSKVLVEDGTPPALYGQIAKDVLNSGHSWVVQFGFRLLFVCPVQSATGRHYVGILTAFEPRSRLFSRPMRLRFWFNLAVAMLPAAFVCMALALYLTHPITRLRATAQRLATGDLSARATCPTSSRRDELGDLARDFDMMAAQIQSLMTAQRRFVADASHELGAPLTRLHLALALLRRQYVGKRCGELERIEREANKLSNLVQQLLLLAGLEAGACAAETLAPISLQSLCKEIIEDVNFEAAHANCMVTSSWKDVTLLGYPQLLRRAIENVLRNAIRYSPAGSEILIDCKVSDDLQNVVLEILDCGHGVPESMLSAIFRPFFRTSPGRESSSGGTGLGLAIANEAVRLHDGAITATNRKGGGLQVTITLPFSTATSEEDLQHSINEA